MPEQRPPRFGGGTEAERFRSLSVLVCDMVGSTDVRVRLGAAGERLVRVHEALARDAVAAHGGTVIKGLGDGTMAVFEAAADAVGAGVRLQRSLDALHRRGEAAELQVRVGVSAGDVSVNDDDCYGLPVAEAVRLCAAADAGDVLVAEVVRALARHSLDVPLTAAGTFDLRGMDEPVHGWRVDWRPRSERWPAFPLPLRLAAPSIGRFVGRRSELATLRGLLTPSAGTRLVLLAGEPGVGKSALATELARALHAETGAVVVYGGCDEELRPPYQPFAQALRHLVRHAPAETLENYARRHGGDLTVLVPDLVDRLGRVAPPRTTLDSSSRYLLFAAVSALLEEVTAETPVVVVLDDLHWADRGTLLLLRHLVTAEQLGRLAIVATFRDSEVHDDHVFGDLLAELHRLGDVHRHDLTGLAGDEVEEIATQLHHGRPMHAPIVAAVHRETEGNPFFAIELLRHLCETGVDGTGSALGDLPQSVRDVVRRRVRRLGDDVVRLLSVGSVLGTEFHLAAIADMAGMHPDTALDLVEKAVGAAILREVPGQSRFRFVHALVQHSLYDELSATRRRRLHRAAAEATERLGTASTAAAHWLAAGDMGEPLRAVAACTAAADEALLARAPDEAVQWYDTALALLADEEDDQLRCELLLRLGEAQRLAGGQAHVRTLRAAATLARGLGDAERMARAALANTRWFSSSVGDANVEQVELLEAALAAVGPQPSATRARLLATLVAELVYSDRPADRFAIADEALDIARRIGDSQALFDVLFWRNTAAKSTQAESGRDDGEVEELRALASGSGNPLKIAMSDLVHVLRSLENGQPGKASESMARAIRLSEELRLPVLRWLVTVVRGTLAALAADVRDAEKLAMEGLELSQATDQPDASTWFGVQLYMVRLEQGRLTELVDMALSAIDRSPRLYTWHAALALALTELDRFDEARAVVEELLAADYPRRRGEPHWLIGMSCLGSAVAALEDPSAAKVVYDALAPCAGRWASIMPLSLGSLDRVRGELSTVLGNYAAGEAQLRAAVAAHDAAPAPGWAARARLGLMRLLAVRGAPGDDAAFATLAAEVRRIVEAHELPRAAELLRRLAASRVPSPSTPPADNRKAVEH